MKEFQITNAAIRSFLALFRDKSSSHSNCNLYVENLSVFLAGAISDLLDQNEVFIKTPLGIKKCKMVNESVVLIPVLRAGIAMLSGFQKILPNSETGFIWAHRDESGNASIDRAKLPQDINGKTAIILDTMLATGGTINLCADIIRQSNAKRIITASILATRFGLNSLTQNIEAAFFIDSSDVLDEKKYIYPGVGDSGDRLFG